MSRARSLVWVLALAALALLSLRAFVGDLFTVGSSSMEPTLFPGDRVLVRFTDELPARGEVVVVRATGDDPLVKRVVGLPGEELSITSSGDLLVDRAPLDRSLGILPLVPVFQATRCGWLPPWSEAPESMAEGGWSLSGSLRTAFDVTDGHLDTEGQWIAGEVSVADLAITLLGLHIREGSTLQLTLTEGGDQLFVSVLPEGGRATVRLGRSAPLPGAGRDAPSLRAPLAEGEAPWSGSSPHALTVANLDDRLLVRLDGAVVLEAALGPATVGPPVQPRVTLEAEEVTFEDLLVERDLHYTRRGAFGVDAPVRLGPGELFLLGDASGRSTDSREFGPVPLGEVLGRVVGLR